MTRIEGKIVITRPVEVVVDCVADQRNEPRYNPRMVRAEKLSDGPIGVGTRFGATITTGRRRTDMVIETTDYDRPRRLASKTTMDMADIGGALTFDQRPAGTVMRWSWNVHPQGVARLFSPLVAAIGGVRSGPSGVVSSGISNPLPDPSSAAVCRTAGPGRRAWVERQWRASWKK